MIEPLRPVPANLVDGRGRLLDGLWAGHVQDDPVRTVADRRGRARRWLYAAGGDERATVGAAVVDVGIGASAFVWAVVERRVWTWERTVVGGRGSSVPTRPSGRAAAGGDGAAVAIEPDGGLRVDVPVDQGRLRAQLTASDVPGSPAVCATRTPEGGWNVTQKRAGYPVAGVLRIGRREHDLRGGGWSDWTAGRQDRHTTWRWAAGAGVDDEGRRVGLNVSTGMNGHTGEDVVWWDGVPHRLDVTRLEPTGADARGSWVVAGPGWELEFDSAAVRAADENLVLLRSTYVQPIGRFSGTLPGRDGGPVRVSLAGVTEDHEARW